MLKETMPLPPIGKAAYKADIEPLKEELGALQHRVKNSGLPVIILFEGWGTAGKGSVLADIILTLDPRNFSAQSTLAPNCVEVREPFLWRHWRSTPPKGLFAIYDRSWYPETAPYHVEGKIKKQELQRRLQSINMFERQMADDGVLIIKFFLHISQKEQKRRLDALASAKSTAWRVDKQDYKNNKRYSQYLAAYEEMLRATDTAAAPWHIIDAQHRRATLAAVYRTLVARIGAALENAAPGNTKAATENSTPAGPLPAPQPGPFTLRQMPTLAEIDLDKKLSDDEYRERLKTGRKKLAKLHNAIYQKRIPVIIAYEGWDAAGKGGNIRRLTSALDPRGYEVVPIASPTPTEKAHQHLWRFWEHLPKDGHITIFDRTWYGRVLVERVEGFADEAAWHRAYRELNEFEAELDHWGAVILKFWLHINKDEQLRRFTARQQTPEKQWKITDEDWRNRDKWDDYELAVNDMIRLTSTHFAPWTIVESQDKKYARIKSIETTIAAIEARL